MKRTFLIVLTFCVSISLHAQKIHFTDSTNVWKELWPEYNFPDPPLIDYYTYSFHGDSTIGSVAYRNFGFGLVREDTILNKVYIRDRIYDTEVVLMDYNLNVGDTFTTLYNQFPVLRIDSTLINGVWHRVWYFPFYRPGWSLSSSYDEIYFIEGIGCLEDPAFMIHPPGCIECLQPFMYCFSHNGATPTIVPRIAWLDNTTSCTTFPTLNIDQLQPHQNKLTIYPNPATTSLNIVAPGITTSVGISNLLGQTLFSRQYNAQQVQVDVSALPKGIYFVTINGTEIRKLVKD